MSIIRPFRGLRPVPEKAEQVAAPPYDVLNSAEARAMAEGNPLSFLRVVKPEISLDPSVDVYADEVYQKGLDNLRALEADGVLVRDKTPSFYLYEQRMRIGDKMHVQVGLMAGASVEEYQKGVIKKHEFTRADKEADRTRHVNKTNANTGPVFLTYRAVPEISEFIEKLCKGEPVYDFTAQDGIGHRMWTIDKKEDIDFLVDRFAEIPNLYIADGHHRSASAAAVCEMRKAENKGCSGDEGHNFFMAVIFPHDRMYIMDYNRIVTDLFGLGESEFLAAVGEKFDIGPAETHKPTGPTQFCMYLFGKWHGLKAKPGTFAENDPVESLDVSILQKNLLEPILGIKDPRLDNRIDFVGGIRGTKELERRVDADGGVAFSLFPTSIEQLMAIADANRVMPPKSTWFEPKLRSGLVVRLLD